MKRTWGVFAIASLVAFGSFSPSQAYVQGVEICAQSLEAGEQLVDGQVKLTNLNASYSLRVQYTYNVYCNAGQNNCSCGATNAIVDLAPSASTNWFGCALPCGYCDHLYCTDVQISAQIIAWRYGTSGAWEDAVGGSCSTGNVGSCLGPTCCSMPLQIGD